MTQKKRGLGRGLGDLGLKELLNDFETTVPMVERSDVSVAKPATQLCDVPIETISPGKYQPRKNFDSDELQELADSIRSQGVIQPVIVRRVENGYELIAGERRWRAAQLVGLDRIPAIVREIKDEAAIAMSLIENIQRSDLNPIEEANALCRLIEEFGLTHQELATAVGKSRVTVTNLLRLLKLNPEVKSLLEKNMLEMGHARALLTLDEKEQSQIANLIVARALSVRETEKLVKSYQEKKDQNKITEKRVDPNISHLQNNLSEILGAKVAIRHGNSGKGKLVIHYNSVDELDGILEHIS